MALPDPPDGRIAAQLADGLHFLGEEGGARGGTRACRGGGGFAPRVSPAYDEHVVVVGGGGGGEEAEEWGSDLGEAAVEGS